MKRFYTDYKFTTKKNAPCDISSSQIHNIM